MNKLFLLLTILMSVMSCAKMNNTEFVTAFPIKTLNLDPHRMEDIFSMSVNTQINASLLRYLGDGEIESSIAKSWSVSPDGLTYLIKLDQKKFSNGEQILAQDVVRSLKRLFIKEASIGVDLATIKGVFQYRVSKNPDDIAITELEKDLVKIILDQPNPVLLKQLATPDTAILKLDDNYEINKSNITSGKYKVISYSESELKLELWNTDQLTSSNPPKYLKYLLSETDKRIELAQAGKIDFISMDNSKGQEIEFLIKNGWKETLGGLTQENFLVFSPKSIPLIWRQYFFQNFSTDDFVKTLDFKNKAPAYGYIPTTLQGSVKAPFLVSFPKVKNEDLPPLKLEISHMGFAGIDYVINFLKKSWNHPKLSIELKKHSVNDFMASVDERKYPTYIITKGLDYPDAMANISYFKSDLKENFFLIADKNVDKKILECSMATDKKNSCFNDIQKMIYDHNIVLPLFYGINKTEYYSDKVKSFPPHPLGLQFMSFDQIEMK
jgi:ABC-type transport system substrate-binding protein